MKRIVGYQNVEVKKNVGCVTGRYGGGGVAGEIFAQNL